VSDPLWIVDQRGAVGDDGVVDCVPVTAELTSDLVHRAAVAADLAVAHRPARSVIANRQAATAAL
jgi:hypothetical protein